MLAHIVVMGIIEGLTEFLPVSSTAHLLIVRAFFNFQDVPGFIFEIVIQFGAIAALLWVYRQKLWAVASQIHCNDDARQFAFKIIVAFLPALVVGALAHDLIKFFLFSALWLICVMLILGGGIMLIVEKYLFTPSIQRIEDMPLHRAFGIGCAQVIAMVPGVSRSGATIVGGMLFGLDRKTAAEFSFFLAIPTILGAAVFNLYDNYHSLNGHNLSLVALGFLVAFVTALTVVRAALYVIERYGFTPFAWYRIGIGCAVLLAVYGKSLLFFLE